jgi:hypothetical protein
MNLPSLLLLFTLAAGDESAADIFRKSRERGALNLLDLTAELKLASSDKSGASKEQVISSSSRRVDGKVRSISRFLSPPGVSGVSILTIEGPPSEGDEISLYLPKIKRVRKVARSQRGDAFMNTDFSYADLGATGGARDDAFSRKPDEKLDGRDVYVLTGETGPESPYGSLTAYVDKQTYVPMKVEYADKAGKPWKVYRTLKLKKFKERTLAAESVMENLQTGTKTKLEVLRLEDSGLGDDAFTERALERG